jgi:hypothetical protein
MGAFYECANLGKVTLHSGIASIGAQAFYGSGITEINLEDSVVTEIPYRCFYQTDKLENFVVPAQIQKIGWAAFANSHLVSIDCSANENLTFDTSELGVFSYCYYLTDIILPERLKELPSITFSDCTSLSKIEIPKSVETIGATCFIRCTKLLTVTIPTDTQLTTIGYGAFNGCSILNDISIGNNVVTISDKAFKDCERLNTLTVPKTTKTIGDNAFDGCSALKTVYIMQYKGSISGEPWGAIVDDSPYTQIIWLEDTEPTPPTPEQPDVPGQVETKTNWFYKKDGNLIPVTPYLMKNGILIKLSTLRK